MKAIQVKAKIERNNHNIETKIKISEMIIKDKDGKYYYALYWDEVRYSEVDFKEGFYVEAKDAIKFFPINNNFFPSYLKRIYINLKLSTI